MSEWQVKIDSADKLKKEWENKFKCQTLEEYYYGFQWKYKGRLDPVPYMPYQLNLFYSTVKIKLAGLLFNKPQFNVSPEPGTSHWNLESAVASAQLKQDALNTIIGNRNNKFTANIKRAALDSFFRFGLIEVGYAADWRNPQKQDPVMKSDLDDQDSDFITPEEDRVKHDEPLPINERIYVKRIKPRRFLVSVSDAEDLEDFEWVGYEDYFYTNQLMHMKGIKWPKNYTPNYYSGQYSAVTNIGIDSFTQEIQRSFMQGDRAVSKVYHIFNNQTMTRCLYLDGNMEEPLWEGEYSHLPLVDIRWDWMCDGFYPVPPCFQWLSAQDEINEAREQVRSYRRRFTRKFGYLEDLVEPNEIEKFTDSNDGACIKMKQKDALFAIDNPELGVTDANALIQAKDDFNTISGTSAEARGQNADRETATQAKLVDQRAQIRESAEQIDFSVFVCNVGREILVQAAENLETSLWVKYTTNPAEQGVGTELQVNSPYYRQISSEDLRDGYDYTIDVDVNNATPQAQAAQEQAFIKFVAYMRQFPELAMSPILIRELAYRVGYRNEQVIHQYQQVAAASMAAKAEQIKQVADVNAGGSGANANNTAQAQMATPNIPQIQDQLQGQLQ